MFEPIGLRLEVVASAEAALRLAHTTAIDLWVINVELPTLSGFELCSMLQARSGHTAVFLVADEYSPATERAAWAARATMFACKGAHVGLLQQWLLSRLPPQHPPRATDNCGSQRLI